MLKGVSEDINAVIDWELAHGNAVSNIPPRMVAGDGVRVFLVRCLKSVQQGIYQELPKSLRPWQWQSPHCPEYEWLVGFQSDQSGDVVCGPLPQYSQPAAG